MQRPILTLDRALLLVGNLLPLITSCGPPG
jgi:hypothetical protein